MMASNLSAIIDQLVTTIALVNGAGGYVHDLSGTDQVVVGELLMPDRVPMVSISLDRLASEDGPSLGEYRRTATWTLVGWTAATADTAIARIKAACDLLDDLCTALEGARTLGGIIYDLRLDGVAFDGAEIDQAGMGVVAVSLTTWWDAASAVGV